PPLCGTRNVFDSVSASVPDDVEHSEIVFSDGNTELARATADHLFAPLTLTAKNVQVGGTAEIGIAGDGTLHPGGVALWIKGGDVIGNGLTVVGGNAAQLPIASDWPAGPSQIVMVGEVERTFAECTGAGQCQVSVQVRSELDVDVQP